jgi:squalene-hopene/tetraprenyl-beta-curcumene cyclase
LWGQQAADGGWHSPQYGVLKSGQALTPFVLDALMRTTDPAGDDRVGRAVKFLADHLNDQGALGLFDPDVTEYPVYSTAYALKCFRLVAQGHRSSRAWSDQIDGTRAYLKRAQYDEADGFSPDDAAYGGWGFQAALAPGRSGHMDLAHTRRALEALAFGDYSDEAAHKRNLTAQSFLRVVQKHPEATARQRLAVDGAPSAEPPPFDGGFYFSPIVLEANKGRVEEEPQPHWRSYATATCDGILALLAAGVPREDARVTAAVRWLKRHSDVDYPQGVPQKHPEPWGEAIRFYHYAVRAEVYRALGFPAAERARLAAAVAKHQRPDGSFVNAENPLMKEDDPVLCTALAVTALSHSLAG